MTLMTRAVLRASTLLELLRMAATGPRLWMLPMFVVFIAAAVLLAAVSVLEYVAPFVYTVF